MIQVGCRVDETLIEPIPIPEQPVTPSNGDWEDMFQAFIAEVRRDALKKKELKRQIDTCNPVR